MNDDESFKLGIVLSYLKQYRASQQLLYPLYKNFYQFKCTML